MKEETNMLNPEKGAPETMQYAEDISPGERGRYVLTIDFFTLKRLESTLKKARECRSTFYPEKPRAEIGLLFPENLMGREFSVLLIDLAESLIKMGLEKTRIVYHYRPDEKYGEALGCQDAASVYHMHAGHYSKGIDYRGGEGLMVDPRPHLEEEP